MPCWISIATFANVEDAYIVKGMLETNDIATNIDNADISSIYPMGSAWSSVYLQVPDTEADKARGLIADSDMAQCLV